MARPKAGYYTKDGKRVPGTTTITSRFKESGGLIHWAWDLGMQGLDYRDVRDKAADTGTLVHAMVEAHAAGEDPEASIAAQLPELQDPARRGFAAYLEWHNVSKIEIVEQEMQMVSEDYRFGGTPDAIGYCAGKLSLLDWKSGSIYPEHVIQVAAYGRGLWAENRPKDMLEAFYLLRFNKDTGGFTHHMLPIEVVNLGWEQFKLLRQAYELDKQIKKAVK
jgi:hypothetical protein